MTKRAMDENQKDARRREILRRAAELLQERDFLSLKLVDIAHALGLVKGTLYLYFPTKEELFVALIEDELGLWFHEMEPIFSDTDGRVSSDSRGPLASLAHSISASLARRPVLVRLFSILNVILERRLAEERLRQFKYRTLELFGAGAERLERAFPFFAGQAGAFLMNLNALAIGIGHMSTHTAVSQKVMQDPSLSLLVVDFETMLESSLIALLKGMVADPIIVERQ